MSNKRDVALYLDRELVEKTRSLGFNLSKTFENHLKHLITQFSSVNSLNNSESTENECFWWAGPDSNRRPSARQAPGTPTETLLTRFREFLKAPEAVASFKFPHQVFKPKQILSKGQLQQFYKCLETPKEKALFLLYATTGLRRDEILSLKLEDVDFEKRMITPDNHRGETKKSWVSFYNDEAEQALNEYLKTKKQSRSSRLFPMQRQEVIELWKRARAETGIDITPQKLRQWFCSEMLRLGVSETYIDAFCGRVPQSVLARHYTDFSLEKLKEIYEKVNLEALS